MVQIRISENKSDATNGENDAKRVCLQSFISAKYLVRESMPDY